MKEERNTQSTDESSCEIWSLDPKSKSGMYSVKASPYFDDRTDVISSAYYGIELTIGQLTRVLSLVTFQYAMMIKVTLKT